MSSLIETGVSSNVRFQEHMEVNLGRNDAADWIYKGEGAANVVLGYRGSLPQFMGKVLRLKKVSRTGSQCFGGDLVLSGYERSIWKDLEDLVASSSKEIISELYIKHVMSPLLGSKYVDAGIHVMVSKDFMELVEENIRNQRPAGRICAAKINTMCDSALLLSDHTLFSHGSSKDDACIAVEIKPKCGFLPSSEFIADANSIKRRTARFRMLQGLKLHQREISRLGKYDPLDLFSGSLDRISRAIEALFANPQNYFRIFLNGSLIFGGLGGSLEDAEATVDQANKERNEFEDVIAGVIYAEHGKRSQSLLRLISEAIHRTKILKQLLEVQKLDSLDIEGAIHAYYDIISQPCLICRNLKDDELLRKYAVLHSLPLEESKKIVRDYLIAATAKDCSVIISYRQSSEGDLASPCSSLYLESTNQKFDYKACFIDLDMKPLVKMVQHFELDQKILKYYSQMEKMVDLYR